MAEIGRHFGVHYMTVRRAVGNLRITDQHDDVGMIELALTSTHGTPVFLEVNPAGQYLFVELETGQPITDCLFHALLAERIPHHIRARQGPSINAMNAVELPTPPT